MMKQNVKSKVIQTVEEPKLLLIPIEKVTLMSGTRAHRDEATIERYVQIWKSKSKGQEFPPVDLFFNGEKYFAGDGNYRLISGEKAGIKMILAKIHNGGEREAYLFSLTANDAHGHPTSAEDKRKQVETLLQDSEWSKWGNNEIARRCDRSGTYVAKVAKELGLDRKSTPHFAMRNGKLLEIDTAKIGDRSKRQSNKPQKVVPEKEVKECTPAKPKDSTEASDATDDRILDEALKQVSLEETAFSDEEALGMVSTNVAANSVPATLSTGSATSNPEEESATTTEPKSLLPNWFGKATQALLGKLKSFDGTEAIIIIPGKKKSLDLDLIRETCAENGAMVLATPGAAMDWKMQNVSEKDREAAYLETGDVIE